MEYTNLILFTLGLFGIGLHNLVKIETINRTSEGNFKFFPFIKIEWPSILISLSAVIVCLIAKGEVKQLQDAGKWLGLSFVTIGYMAQSLIYKYLGKAEKAINENNG